MERAACNFCEFSSFGYGCGSEDKDAELRREVEKLRLLIKRISGKDDTLTLTELLALINHLQDVRSILQDQKKKVELEEEERLRERTGGVLVPCSQVTYKKCAPLLTIKRDFERRNAESLQAQFDRLWLLNERMNGRQLNGLTSYELICLHTHILRALIAVRNLTSALRREQIATQQEPLSLSLDNHNYASLLVSRKLRRFHRRYQRKRTLN